MTAWTNNPQFSRRSGNNSSGSRWGDDSPGDTPALGRTLTDADSSYTTNSEFTPVSGAAIQPVLPASDVTGGSSSAGSANGGANAAVGSSGAASPFVINVTYDQTALPTGFVAAINYVVSYYESIFTTSATVNIDVGYGSIAGQSLGNGALGESETYIDPDNYSDVASALKSHASSPAQQAAYATLPATSPFTGDQLWVATAEEKALGLIPANGTDLDGYVGFSSVYPFSYSSSTPPAGDYYFIGVVEHEFSEVMGRDSFEGDSIGGTTPYAIMDMFRYSAPGVRDFTETPPVSNTAYFSINSGTTDLGNWNINPNGDMGDWAGSVGADSYLAFSPSGQVEPVTSADLEVMNVLGYQEAGTVGSTGPLVVSGGSTVFVSAGQTSTGINVLSGGLLTVLNGGTASGTLVSGGGVFADYGSASATVVRGAGTDFVESGGVETGAVLSSGGTEFVEAGGVARGLTLSSGAIAANFGSASGTIVSNGGTDFAEAGGIETGATLLAAGYQYIESGGTANGTVVSSGGIAANYGGLASGTVTRSGGLDYVEAGGTESGATVSNGGIEYIVAGGTAKTLTVSSGGIVANYGGSMLGTIVSNGGLDYVEAAGIETGAVLSNGGVEYIEAGGKISGLTVLGGGIVANYGGSASATVVMSGGLDYVEAAGTETGATLSNGGVEYIIAGGTAKTLKVSSGGVVANVGGSASGTIIASGGLDYVEVGGIESSAAVSSGGVEYIAGGTADGLAVSNGGNVDNYGRASGTIISGGGTEFIGAGGAETGATLSSGGVEYIFAGGTANSLTVSKGGIVANYGGSASGTMVRAGGQDYLEAGAVETGATLLTGGAEYIMAGGTASGVTISGGVVDLASGGVIGGMVDFSSSGELILAASQNFSGLVAGFNSTTTMMDLQDISYVPGATMVSWTQADATSGTLTVSEGGHAANITLLGQYSTGNFIPVSDQHGGTIVVDPPLTAPNEMTPQTLTTAH